MEIKYDHRSYNNTEIKMDYNRTVEKGNVLLHHAVKHKSLEFIKDLLSKEVNVNIDEFDNNNQNALHIAVSNARENIVSLLIENGADINKKERCLGMTPLHLAIKAKHLEIAKLLLRNGAKLNITNKQNSTALYSALEEENKDMIKLILDYGANVDSKKFGKTPLHYAVEYGQINMVKLLLEKGSNVNEPSMDGQTALHMAIERKDEEMVKLLLENKAKTDLQKFGKYPLHLAVQAECPEILRLLLKATEENEHKEKSIPDALQLAFEKEAKNLVEIFLEFDFNISYKVMPKSPLHLACFCGWEDIVRKFIAKGLDVNALAPDNITALMIAVKNEHISIVEILIKEGAEVNVQLQRSGLSALHFAVEDGTMAMVCCLLENGANTNVVSNLSVTPLHMALDGRNLELVKLLMDYGADSNTPKCGKKSLEIAVENGWHELVKRMLEKGASPDTSNRNGKCVLVMAIKNQDLEMMKLLIQAGANINYVERRSEMSPLQYALLGYFDEAVLMLMDLGADLDYATSSGLTALHLALERPNQQMVLLLLERGSSPHIKQRSMPPLHVAVSRLWYQVAEILLAKGVDVNGRTVYNATPLYFAVQRSELHMARLLIEHGANVNFVWDGQSLLQFAASTKCPAMVELLLDHGAAIGHLNKADGECINALYTALKSSDDATACLLIKRGASLRSRNQKLGRTPLHLAAEYGCTEAANLLLDRGVQIDVEDCLKMTPLHMAAMSNRLEMIELLIRRGAEVNACSRGELYTSLHFAVYNDNCDMVLKLLKSGALMHISQPEHQRQKTSLDVAVSQGRSRRLIEILLSHDILEHETGLDRREIFIHLIKLSSWPLLTELLIRHLAKFDAAIQREFFERTTTSNFVQTYYRNCVNEITAMKQHVVYEGITLHYLFVSRGFNRVSLVRNQLLLDALDQFDFKANYPIYERMLNDHLNEAKAAKVLYADAEKAMELIFHYHLPSLVIQRILDFMTKDELDEKRAMLPILTHPEKKD